MRSFPPCVFMFIGLDPDIDQGEKSKEGIRTASSCWLEEITIVSVHLVFWILARCVSAAYVPIVHIRLRYAQDR